MSFNWRGRERKADLNGEYEFYEDTHNERGEYIGNKQEGFKGNKDINVAAPTESKMAQNDNVAMPMNNGSKHIIVYYPKTPEDVTFLINHLKLNNPAIVNLDNIGTEIAQRILDLLSGAMCALSGSTHRITGNIFLLSPKGVEITIPYEQK